MLPTHSRDGARASEGKNKTAALELELEAALELEREPEQTWAEGKK